MGGCACLEECLSELVREAGVSKFESDFTSCGYTHHVINSCTFKAHLRAKKPRAEKYVMMMQADISD